MATTRKVLKTEAAVIQALGGTSRCAERWDRPRSAVSNWKRVGIPTGLHLRIEHALEAEGYVVDVKALGWI